MLDSIVYACMCAWYLVLLVAALVVLVVLACVGVAGVYAVFVNCIVPTTNNWKVNNAITKQELLELKGIDARETDKEDVEVLKKWEESLEVKGNTAKQADEQNMEILKKW